MSGLRGRRGASVPTEPPPVALPGCGHTFSVTSGTIFAHHKLPLQVYLGAIAIYTNAVKGLSALQLSRDLDIQYKTAFVLMHKRRQSLMDRRDETPLAGEVQIDGGYVGGSVRPANQAEEGVDRRLAEHQNPDKRCVRSNPITPTNFH